MRRCVVVVVVVVVVVSVVIFSLPSVLVGIRVRS